MSGRVGYAALGLVLVAIIIGLAFKEPIDDFFNKRQPFSINSVQFESMIGHKIRLPEGMNGYILFYSDLKGCTACMEELIYLRDIASHFEDIGVFSVLQGDDNRQSFAELLASYEIPGEYLVDTDMTLQYRLALSNNPHLMFFNRHGQMVACLPLNVDHARPKELFYKYIEEL